jgi:hypothetical protein
VDTTPPGRSPVREILESAAEAGLSSVPLLGGALAVAFKTALGWRLQRRIDEWLTGLAEKVDDLSRREGLEVDQLADNPLFVDAVVTATRTVEHAHQGEKISALQNAVLNSVGPDAPDADTQALFFGLVDRFTPSHLRLLALWDDPPAWFASHDLTPPAGIMAGSRTLTVEAGLPEMAGRGDFYGLIASELGSAGLLGAGLSGVVTGTALMDRLTTDFGRRFLRFISPAR